MPMAGFPSVHTGARAVARSRVADAHPHPTEASRAHAGNGVMARSRARGYPRGVMITLAYHPFAMASGVRKDDQARVALA